MRCPKCKYISFDSVDRCRNCGYEFALTPETAGLDLPIQTGDEALGPLGDLSIDDIPMTAPASAGTRRRGAVQAALPEDGYAPPSRPITGVFDLPLFKDRPLDDDTPLVQPPAVPRQPLSVRRSGPAVPRAPRVLTDEPVLDLDVLEPDAPPLRHVAWLPKKELRARVHTPAHSDARSAVAAGVAPRIFAGIVDGTIIASICGVVLYITLQVCGLRFDQVLLLPIPPLAGFLLFFVGGYFVLLTAADGQTLGKMAAGVRVVPMESGGRLSLGNSTMRAVGYIVSVLPAGMGLLPALFHQDRRALHDRLADTRVVKA